jgi:arsenate reductase
MDNSCASQIAEGIAKCLAPPKTRIFSAGITPIDVIHPLVAKVMKEVGISISGQNAKGLGAVPLEEIDLAVTLSEEIKEKCPALPSRVKLEHWSIPDLKRASGGEAAMQAVFCYVRDEIDKKIAALFLDHWRNVA